MITKITTHSVEDWAKEFESSMKTRELTQDEARDFIQLNMIKSSMEDIVFEARTVEEAIEKMAKSYPYTIDKSSIIALGMFIKSLGSIRMILAYLQYKLHKHKMASVDLNFIGMRVFPNGFPTEGFMEEMWMKQKYTGRPDNMLDYSEAYESIKLK